MRIRFVRHVQYDRVQSQRVLGHDTEHRFCIDDDGRISKLLLEFHDDAENRRVPTESITDAERLPRSEFTIVHCIHQYDEMSRDDYGFQLSAGSGYRWWHVVGIRNQHRR